MTAAPLDERTAKITDVRAFVLGLAEQLDPASRYVPELLAIVDASEDVALLVRRLQADSRGMRHAGAHVFARMTLEQKLRCNLVTNETVLFRFTEGEWQALDRKLLPMFERRPGRILSAPCSHGEEAFTLAAACLQANVEFRIDAVDIQPECIEEAKSGRLTMGFPIEHLSSQAVVGPHVLDRIAFRVGDLLATSPVGGIPEAKWDLVVCRNFLGYFVEEVATDCAKMLAKRVDRGGALFLDSFCLQKFVTLESSLTLAGLKRDANHPVFLRAP